MKSKIEKTKLLDAVFHIAIPRKIIPRMSKELIVSLLEVLLVFLIGIGTNYLTAFIGGDAAQKYFQEWIKNLFSTINSFSLVIPMTVVVIFSSLITLLKSLIEITEKRKSLPKNDEDDVIEQENDTSR